MPSACVPVAELLRLADKIENEHVGVDFCPCCTTDAMYLRDLAARHEPAPKDAE